MQAIVNVHPESAFAKFNGQTFKVAELLSTIIGLDINGTITDFSFREVIIVDFQKEYQRAYDAYNWNGNSSACALYFSLYNYRNAKNIQFEPEYTCPA